MAVDNIARGLAASALKKGGITPEQLEEGLAKKLDKTGGTVTGNLAIQGDLTVAGTTKSEKTKWWRKTFTHSRVLRSRLI